MQLAGGTSGNPPGVLRKFQGRISDESHRGWRKLKLRTGATYSGLLEAIGLHLDEHPEWVPPEVVDKAHEVDEERHSR